MKTRYAIIAIAVVVSIHTWLVHEISYRKGMKRGIQADYANGWGAGIKKATVKSCQEIADIYSGGALGQVTNITINGTQASLKWYPKKEQ